MVYAAVRAVLGGRDDVEDVVQNTFIKVYGALPRFRADARLSSWIYRIARNEAIDAARRTRAGDVSLADVEPAAPSTDRPDVRFRAREHREHLESFLARLDEDHRIALELRYLGEKSYAEISEITGHPVGTVKSHVHRARAELKRMMSAAALREDGPRRAG